MKRLLALVLIVSVLFIPTNAVAESDINFHDAITKFYNDNGFPKQAPVSPLVLETTFSVDGQLNIYFMIEPSDDNLPYSDPDNYQMRITLRNNTWSYTDLGQFGDGADLTAPTNPYTVVPGFDYTVQMEIDFTEAVVNINDSFEFSVIIGIESGGAYDPSDSISHIVKFTENPNIPPITASTEDFHPLWILATVGVVIFVSYFIITRRKLKKENEEKD